MAEYEQYSEPEPKPERTQVEEPLVDLNSGQDDLTGHPALLDEEYPSGQGLRSEQVADERRYALLRSLKTEEGAEQIVQSMSQQLLLRNDANWGDLLSAAPQALCCLGQCFVATTSSTVVSSLKFPTDSTLEYVYSLLSSKMHP